MVFFSRFYRLVVLTMQQNVCFYQVYSSLDLSRGHLEEKGEAEGKKSESPLTLDSLSWTPDFAEMYVCLFVRPLCRRAGWKILCSSSLRVFIYEKAPLFFFTSTIKVKAYKPVE